MTETDKKYAPKTLFGYDYTHNETVKFLLYLMIGGTAALFEWAMFYVFWTHVGLHYELATLLAFTLSTLCHYYVGNVLVFHSGTRYGKRTELSLVLAVSAIGLGFNMLLMHLFVGMVGLHPMLSKVLCSAIVVFWNYLSRKKWIFAPKEK